VLQAHGDKKKDDRLPGQKDHVINNNRQVPLGYPALKRQERQLKNTVRQAKVRAEAKDEAQHIVVDVFRRSKKAEHKRDNAQGDATNQVDHDHHVLCR